MELNKSKPFGEIGGEIDGFPNARFTQDGFFFNNKGEQIGGEIESPEELDITPEINIPKETAEDEAPAAEKESFNILSLLDNTIPTIVAALPGLSDDEICTLYLAEIDGKTRSGLIKAIDEYRANAAV